MICRRNDDEQHKQWVQCASEHETDRPGESTLAPPDSERLLEEARMPEEGAANHQRIREMQTGHGSKLIEATT